mmetsp:Transcript_129876/g.277270  ORF Transcript_129876/g.277270 Transcript_129876/m.277270 type:complete len:309 (-) Transcript_129876:17-943(-)
MARNARVRFPKLLVSAVRKATTSALPSSGCPGGMRPGLAEPGRECAWEEGSAHEASPAICRSLAAAPSILPSWEEPRASCNKRVPAFRTPIAFAKDRPVLPRPLFFRGEDTAEGGTAGIRRLRTVESNASSARPMPPKNLVGLVPGLLAGLLIGLLAECGAPSTGGVEALHGVDMQDHCGTDAPGAALVHGGTHLGGVDAGMKGGSGILSEPAAVSSSSSASSSFNSSPACFSGSAFAPLPRTGALGPKTSRPSCPGAVRTIRGTRRLGPRLLKLRLLRPAPGAAGCRLASDGSRGVHGAVPAIGSVR